VRKSTARVKRVWGSVQIRAQDRDSQITGDGHRSLAEDETVEFEILNVTRPAPVS
jgi:hypothetical protein